MRILLLRHGTAVSYYDAPSDETRWLTPEGRRGVNAVGAELRERGVKLTRVYTSPFVRAVQTAEALLSEMDPDFQLSAESLPGLAADSGTTAQALAPLSYAGQDETIALVTHMPKVSALAAHLTGRGSFAPFPTAGVCLLERGAEGEAARVLLQISPEQLRA